MGNSLHNKIYLGRKSILRSRPIQAAILAGAMAGLSVVWIAMRAFK
ncbi:MAG: hypothetical protein ACLGI6_10840 [Gammaproteobacteria bacterium]